MTTYYVDYATGSDSNSGASISAPWKHAPGDSNATGKVVKASLVGGDKVLFKAGVVYQGSLFLRASGTDGNPIVYEGTGWGTGQAILNGQTTVQATFTRYAGDPRLSVATLPAGLVPSAYSVVDIDGQQSFVSNTSASTNPYFLANSSSSYPNATSYAVSEMTGAGTAWTLTDATLAAKLRSLNPSTLNGMVLKTFGSANRNYDLTIVGFNSRTGAVSLSGTFYPASTGSYTLMNNPAFVSASNPYSEYAVEGNQIIAAVTPGVHSVSVSTSSSGFLINNQSNITIDGFTITGYGGGLGEAINGLSTSARNLTVTNNTISQLASQIGEPAIYAQGITNVTITGNTITNLIRNEGIREIIDDTNVVVKNNTIDQPGATAIYGMGDTNAAISYNRISNVWGVHANGISMYDVDGHISQNVSIANNEISGVLCGITFEGYKISATPNNLTIANNIITNATGFGIADWGNTNTAKIFGNIVLVSSSAYGPLSLSTTSRNVSFYDNILQKYGWMSASGNLANTFSNNVALTAGNVPNGSNNTVNTALASVLSMALASGRGTLADSIGGILSPTGTATIGIGYTTGHGSGNH